MSGMRMTRQRMSKYHDRPAHDGEDQDRDHHHDEQERRAAAQVQRLVLLDVGDRERLAVLEGVDRHVLGAVVLEDAPQVAELGDDGEIGDEDADADEALDEPEPEAGAELGLKRRVMTSGARKKRATAKPRATMRVRPISFLVSSCSSSPSDWLAEMVMAFMPMTSDSTRAVTPRRMGSLSTG